MHASRRRCRAGLLSVVALAATAARAAEPPIVPPLATRGTDIVE